MSMKLVLTVLLYSIRHIQPTSGCVRKSLRTLLFNDEQFDA